MARQIDAPTLGMLRGALEVRIRTGESPGRGPIIWVVVADDEVFVRSFRGATGRWYEAAVNNGRAVLEKGDWRMEVQVVKVTEATVIESVSKAYLTKYAGSPYAKEMVRAEALATTLRMEPV